MEVLRAFLGPCGGGYSWQAAYTDVENLVGILGRAVEVRGHPLGKLLRGKIASPMEGSAGGVGSTLGLLGESLAQP